MLQLKQNRQPNAQISNQLIVGTSKKSIGPSNSEMCLKKELNTCYQCGRPQRGQPNNRVHIQPRGRSRSGAYSKTKNVKYNLIIHASTILYLYFCAMTMSLGVMSFPHVQSMQKTKRVYLLNDIQDDFCQVNHTLPKGLFAD